MKIILCLDDHNGMLFNRRRQSKDRALRERVLQLAAGSKLWMNAYSASQFEKTEGIEIREDFLETAGREDYCFVENADISAYAHRVTEVIVYRWNRVYPADTYFPEELFSRQWKRISCEEFSGTSHDTITQEVYKV